MTRRATGPLACALLALFAVLLVALGVLSLTAPPPPPGVEPFTASGLVHALAVLGFMAVGALLGLRVPGNPLGWILCAFALIQIASPLSYIYAFTGMPGQAVAAWLSSWLWIPPIAVLGVALLLFPDGQLPSPRWRWVLAAAGTGIAFALATGAALWPYRGVDLLRMGDAFPGVAAAVSNVALPLVFGSAVAGAGSVVVRFRRSRGVARMQVKWLALATALVAVSLIGFVIEDLALGGAQTLVGEIISALALLAVPAAFGVAVLRYRLYEIDRIVSRTVTYALVTAALAAVYGLVGVLPSALFQLESDLLVATATLVAAAAFVPLRRRVQAVVDRRFNRSRYDAARVVDGFMARLRAGRDLDDLARDVQAAVAQTVQPAQVSLWVRGRP